MRATTDVSHLMQWWYCPNDPPCPHGSVLHDKEDMEDARAICCVEGCECGKVKE